MHQLRWLLIISILGWLSLPGCKHKPIIDDMDPPPDTTGIPCSPDTVYFGMQILPILVSNCAMPGCHHQNNPEEDLDLTSYETLMASGAIKPGQLKDKFWEAITETDPDDRMPPPPASPLSAAQIDLIRIWILQGAQNLMCDPDPGSCDTTAVSFAVRIRPIFQTYCIGCHNNSVTNGGVNLANFEGVTQVVQNGRLLGSVRHLPGFVAMPQGGSQIPACEQNRIEAWINQGALNN